MRKIFIPIALVFLFSILALPCLATDDDKAERKDVLYVCACGNDCKCGSVSVKPGTCNCGGAMKWTHVVRIEGSTALLCNCDEGCKCSIDKADMTKCGCGKPVEKAELKGKGIYFCNCKGACGCGTVSDKEDKCKCGMKLHE